MKKTLGGDRLGSGKKMKVELKNYERSTHNLGYIWRSTMSAGTLVPFMSELALPGDTFDIDLDCDIKTHPTIGPLFGSYKVQLDVFEAPIRLYHAQLHNNKLGIGMNMAGVLLPQLTLTAFRPTTDVVEDVDNTQINPSSILAYLGIRGIGTMPAGHASESATREFNAVPLLAYWDIYKNYYSNKQEEKGYVIHSMSTEIIDTITGGEIVNNVTGVETAYAEHPAAGTYHRLTGDHTIKFAFTGTQPIPSQIMIRAYLTSGGGFIKIPFSEMLNIRVESGEILGDWNAEKYGEAHTRQWKMIQTNELINEPIRLNPFALEYIDLMREAIMSQNGSPDAFNINEQDLPPYNLLFEYQSNRNPYQSSQEGLGVKTYQSDLFNNWLQTEWIDGPTGISAVTAIDTTSGSFTIDTLNLAKKVYDMLNRVAVSGGTYDDWLDVTYTHDRITRAESPIYHGGLIKELVFQEVVSNAGSAGGEGEQPLGTLAGKGILAKKHKGGKIVIRVHEPSYIIGIISLTPRIDYSQGNKWDVHLKTMDDLHKPALDEIGFQELITEQMAWWDTRRIGAEWVTKSAGKQPAWINYMTNVNRVLGNFAIPDPGEMFMILNRRYEPDYSLSGVLNGIKDVTTYIDPVKYNHIFADTSIDAQNFWAQISVDNTARRKMSAKLMPNL